MLCWMNGQYIEAEALRISPLEHGYLYGVGFFETFRTYDGVAVFFEAHFTRLMEALQAYHLTLPYTLNELKAVIETLDEASGGTDGYFRLNVAAGNYGLGLQPATYDEVTVIMFRKELASGIVQQKEARWINVPRNTPEHHIRYKSHHFGNNVLARQQLPNLAAYEGLFVTAEGYVAEGVTSNVFWAKDGVLYTPSVDLGILPGVTRARLLTLADEIALPFREGRFSKHDVEAADELFVTNSIQELVPIGQLGEKQFAGEEGPIFKKLSFAYRHDIASKVRGEYR